MNVVMWLFVLVGVCEWMGPPMGGPIPFHPHPLVHPTTNPIVWPNRFRLSTNNAKRIKNRRRVFVRFNELKTPR
jgi:hypothetical protein